jgi:hypothetical protein
MHEEHQVPIWFFVGGIVLIYGVLILGSGVYGLSHATDVEQSLRASWPEAPWFFLHPEIWWGAVMTVFGLIYCYRFNPLRPGETLTGKDEKEGLGGGGCRERPPCRSEE